MKKYVLFVIITLIFQIRVKGNPSWIPIDNSKGKQCLSIATIESNENKYKALIKIHGLYDRCISDNGSAYHQLSFDEPAKLNKIGEPALPLISRLVSIPKGDIFKARITNEKWTDTIFVGQVLPSQESVLENEETPPFKKKIVCMRKMCI